MKKTVLFIIDGFHIGGISTFVKQYTEILIKESHKVIIVGHRGNLVANSTFFPKKAILIEIPHSLEWSMVGRLRSALRHLQYLHGIFIKYDVFSSTFFINPPF